MRESERIWLIFELTREQLPVVHRLRTLVFSISRENLDYKIARIIAAHGLSILGCWLFKLLDNTIILTICHYYITNEKSPKAKTRWTNIHHRSSLISSSKRQRGRTIYLDSDPSTLLIPLIRHPSTHGLLILIRIILLRNVRGSANEISRKKYSNYVWLVLSPGVLLAIF